MVGVGGEERVSGQTQGPDRHEADCIARKHTQSVIHKVVASA